MTGILAATLVTTVAEDELFPASSLLDPINYIQIVAFNALNNLLKVPFIRYSLAELIRIRAYRGLVV